MAQLAVGSRVKVVSGVMRTSPHRGTVGEVKSLWFASSTLPFYEVEFMERGSDAPIRELLRGEHLLPQPESPIEQCASVA